jgi:hypothetical protein
VGSAETLESARRLRSADNSAAAAEFLDQLVQLLGTLASQRLGLALCLALFGLFAQFAP